MWSKSLLASTVLVAGVSVIAAPPHSVESVVSSASSASASSHSGSGSSASAQVSTTTTVISASVTAAVSTVIASPTVPLASSVPSQVALPPAQKWCPSEIFCAGELLQTVNVAQLYTDPKTFVDKPTSKSSQSVLSDFSKLSNASVTEGAITDFVDQDFKGEGLELEALTLANFNANPPFLGGVVDPVVKAWAGTVHGYWTSLIRGTKESTLCGGKNDCESSLIPLNHTFVVPGGRFREQYYWDSFWIVEGLIESRLFDVVNDTLQNFMDELEDFGFIPNGGRIYYLNRSQPPLFTHMLARYIAASNDTSILKRALPLAEREMTWWQENRTLNVTSPFTNKTHAMSRYAVTNSAPRPESYFTDYHTANDPTLPALNETERSALYAELASGAETGWDYTARWTTIADGSNVGLRTLHVRDTLPICLNSILYKAHLNIAAFYSTPGFTSPSKASTHTSRAQAYKAGIIDLFWDAQKLAFYDFNLLTHKRNTIFTTAHFYPFWSGIIPTEVLKSGDNAFKAFSSVNMVMSRYNGTFPTTFLDTGLQWDAPNSWPPHQYIALSALRALPANITSGSIPGAPDNQSTFALIPAGQLGLEENQLPGQPIGVDAGGKQVNASATGTAADVNLLSGGVVNGGNGTEKEGWAKALQRQLANRYIASALCGWHATGGEIPGVLPRLSDEELNITQSITNTGNMFEKFSVLDIDSAGRGGEYTVQAGFGWTNGVVLWIASNYGSELVQPACPDLKEAALISSGAPGGGSGGSNTTGGSTTGGKSGGDGGKNGAVGMRSGLGWVGVLAVVGGLMVL